MIIFLYCVLIFLIIGIFFCIKPYLKAIKNAKKLKVYEDITKNVLNTDVKTRKQIEKLCNEYLEHKVINSKIVNDDYLQQCNIILDEIKFINMINAIEPVEPKEEKKSLIEQAISENEKVDKPKKEKKGCKSNKGEKS